MGVALILIWCVLGGASCACSGTASSPGHPHSAGLANPVRAALHRLRHARRGRHDLPDQPRPAASAGSRMRHGSPPRRTTWRSSSSNSVIAFVPLFLCWGWLLSRYDFRPAEVLLLFGLNGTLAETITFGPQNLIQVGMWVWVYGLMAYLPACTVPEDRGARPARWWHWLMAIFLPLVFIIPLVLWLARWLARVAWGWIARKRRGLDASGGTPTQT